MKFEELFDTLNSLNVNDKKESRTNGKTELSYLSWTWAVTEFTKVAPDFDYEIKMFPNEHGVMLPYMYDEETGYMVMTSVTACGKTKTMWLPVMDGANNAMKSRPYQYNTKYGPKSVEAATMFDINKTIMRCLTKNLAMFGLGLYIYAGEDLPENDDGKETTPKPVTTQPVAQPTPTTPTVSNQETPEWRLYYNELLKLCPDKNRLIEVSKLNGVHSANEITKFKFDAIKRALAG